MQVRVISVASQLRQAGLRSSMLLVGLAVSTMSAGCGAQKAPKAQESAAAVQAAQPDPGLPAVLATIDGTPVTLADVRARSGELLDLLDMRYRKARYQIVKQALDSLIQERVLAAEAKKQGKTVDDLLAAESGSAGDPTDVEVVAWYQANQSRLSGRPLDQLRPQIMDLLRKQRRAEGLQKLQQKLYADQKVAVKLPPFRLAVADEGAPALGPKDAPITLVEFADFQCPYCRELEPALKQVRENFKDQVKVVFRQFPLTSIHPYALKAAEASLCADDQGKFWAMHDQLYGDQSKLAISDLKAAAGKLGLDQKKFDKCLDSGQFTERIEQDQKDGTRLGINGTPALFINGAPVEGGAVPYAMLADAIQKELDSKKN